AWRRRATWSAEDLEHKPADTQVEERHIRDHGQDEDEDDHPVGDQLLARRPDDLAQLSDDLTIEGGEAGERAATSLLLRRASTLRGRGRPARLRHCPSSPVVGPGRSLRRACLVRTEGGAYEPSPRCLRVPSAGRHA